MPKPLSRKHVSEEYESDDGFVEDAPKSKKQKREPKQVNPSVQKDDEGNEYWELSGKRRVTLSEFKGQTMLSIREYYEKDGKTLPGKKGISMSIDQYSTFLSLIPDIEARLEKRKVAVPRPQYDRQTKADADEDRVNDEEEEEEEDEDEPPPKRIKGKLDKSKMKKNHEATSDEDGD